jgi:hypothetical protein
MAKGHLEKIEKNTWQEVPIMITNIERNEPHTIR